MCPLRLLARYHIIKSQCHSTLRSTVSVLCIYLFENRSWADKKDQAYLCYSSVCFSGFLLRIYSVEMRKKPLALWYIQRSHSLTAANNQIWISCELEAPTRRLGCGTWRYKSTRASGCVQDEFAEAGDVQGAAEVQAGADRRFVMFDSMHPTPCAVHTLAAKRWSWGGWVCQCGSTGTDTGADLDKLHLLPFMHTKERHF